MLINKHRETCDCWFPLRAQRNYQIRETGWARSGNMKGNAPQQYHRAPVATRKIAPIINMAPGTRSARRPINQDCPRTGLEGAVERRAARLPLHAAASWQARACLLVGVPASWLKCSRMHMLFSRQCGLFRVDSICSPRPGYGGGFYFAHHLAKAQCKCSSRRRRRADPRSMAAFREKRQDMAAEINIVTERDDR
jgi:hypothetical protein